MTKRNKIIYWTTTVLLALGMFSGGLAQIFRVKENIEGIVHLGYPIYLMSILGVWKILGVIAILLPKTPLLKEWAYAGFFFAMTGAVISHIASGDGFAHYLAPLLFAILTVLSWYFRPADRKIIFNKK
ncbi:DoxX family protein [Sinomicrobium pectinilyticum]|uniref:DoxX family protein n=1 Tax=Sinomicrobium pectinilyticum TaxID=1084421 RepID=A0A3N0DP21_SINP1|nr:DoxX family protein [Sinomicrobium pectinilyticum]RNL77389.1 DoxX family protein [Sinomicrobium pectinilyticum]